MPCGAQTTLRQALPCQCLHIRKSPTSTTITPTTTIAAAAAASAAACSVQDTLLPLSQTLGMSELPIHAAHCPDLRSRAPPPIFNTHCPVTDVQLRGGYPMTEEPPVNTVPCQSQSLALTNAHVPVVVLTSHIFLGCACDVPRMPHARVSSMTLLWCWALVMH